MHKGTSNKSSSPPEDSPLSLADHCFRSILVITVLLTILCICQQFYGIGFVTRHVIPNQRIQKMEGYYRWKFPEQYRAPIMERRAKFYENNRRWENLSHASRDLPALGPGWFHWIDGGVNFVPKGKTDPRKSDTTYSIVSPYQFKPRVWWILASLITFLTLLGNHLRKRGRLRPPFPVQGVLWKADATRHLRGELIIFACALTAILSSLYSNRDLTDHAFMVKGLPESDAAAWFEMAVGLTEGLGFGGGFQNQRPFYSIYLSGLFSFFGVQLTVAQGFNALCLALSSAGIYTIGKLVNSRWLGLVLSISAMTATTHLDYVHAIISENGGTILSVLSLLGAWLATWQLSRRWAFSAGLLNGLAALTSGVTLLTLPLYALIVTFYPLWRRTHWHRALQLGLIYTLAATIPVGSWIVRQKIVNDRFTLSFNTAEVLAGGADPVYGHLSSATFTKAEEEGVNLNDPNERYDYFMGSFKKTVAADPVAYLRKVIIASIDSIDHLPYRVAGFHLTLLLGLLGFGLWPAIQRGQWIAFLIACLLMYLWVQSEFDVNPTMLAAAIFLMWRRASTPSLKLVTLLLISTTLATMLLSGVTGNVATKRFWLVSDWSAFALLLGGSKYLIVTFGTFSHQLLTLCRAPVWLAGTPDKAPSPDAAFDPPPFIACSSIAWIILSLTCATATLVQNLRRPHSTIGLLGHLDTTAIARQGLMRPISQNPAITPISIDHMAVQMAQLGDLHTTMNAKEGTQHWLQVYGPRPYPRWIAKFDALSENGQHTGYFTALGQNSLLPVPKNTPLVVVGIKTDSFNSISKSTHKLFEVCLIIPLTRPTPDHPWEPDFDNQISFPPTPEARAILSPSSPPQR